MKRLIILAIGFAVTSGAQAQTIFFEDFDGINGPTFGGAGTYAFAPGWRVFNVDNNPPNGQVGYVNNGWIRREDFGFNVTDSCAFSTSYYSPTGTANDFMWTPLIGPLPDHCELSWQAKAYDPAYADGYEVRIMTVVPTGNTGDAGNQLTHSTVLFSTTAENNAWTTHTVSLHAYTGQMVYIGFRNNSVDKFLLAVDDVKIERVVQYDPRVIYANTFEYTTYPLQQAANLPLSGVIRNEGVLPITNVSMRAEVYNSAQILVYTQTSVPVAIMNPGATASFSVAGWTPTATGQYRIKYFPVLDQAESSTANDTLFNTINIHDSLFARDDNDVSGNLGIGAGNGYLGQSFSIQSTTKLRSVSAAYTRGYTGRKYALTVWSTAGGKPDVLIGSTDTLLYPDDNALTDTIPIHGGPLTLTPGEYVVAAVEFDSMLALIQTRGIFTPGKVWVQFNALPWQNIEAFGSSFMHPFYIRLHVSNAAVLPVKLVSFDGRHTPSGNQLQWKVADQQGILSYVVERSVNGGDFTSIGSVPANDQLSYTYRFTDAATLTGKIDYRLRIVEQNTVSYSKVIRLAIAGESKAVLWPNPVRTTTLLQSNDRLLLNTTASLADVQGRIMKTFKLTRLPFAIDMSILPGGVYFLRLSNNQVLRLLKE
ncbi:MAG: T9SS type A sorting domain-containing protein [Niastella sp.]|nr:T9SS type A sorting domain-containing protein [Niastella sp.]